MEWIKGMDLSTLLEVEECGGHFSDNGVPGDCMEILKNYGMNLVRLRLWNDPYSPDGTPYGAGTCDLPHVMRLANRAKALDINWLLDFQYSDFWADPGKQTTPKAWQGFNAAELEAAVYDYTMSVLTTLRDSNLSPAIVAVGNELTNGLLWPLGRKPEFANIARFVSAGISATREVLPQADIMIHLDDGSNNALYRDWFDNYLAHGGADFDIIGMSHYPFWNGGVNMLQANMTDMARRYGKDVLVVELASGFTPEDYAEYEQLAPSQRKGMAAKPQLAAQSPYPMTPEGQCDYLRDVASAIRAVPEGHGRGFCWWEPAWLPVPGSGWANDAALAYTGEQGPGGNEWANLCLFDYDGSALPTLRTIREM